MDQELIVKAAVIFSGVIVGGGFLVWFAKLMASRLIKQYDDKHREHDKELKEISSRLAVQDHIVKELESDINAAHCKIRSLENER